MDGEGGTEREGGKEGIVCGWVVWNGVQDKGGGVEEVEFDIGIGVCGGRKWNGAQERVDRWSGSGM